MSNNLKKDIENAEKNFKNGIDVIEEVTFNDPDVIRFSKSTQELKESEEN